MDGETIRAIDQRGAEGFLQVSASRPENRTISPFPRTGPNSTLVAQEIAAMREGPPVVAAMSEFGERAIATVLHVACRSLGAAGIATGRVWPITPEPRLQSPVCKVQIGSADKIAGWCLVRRKNR